MEDRLARQACVYFPNTFRDEADGLATPFHPDRSWKLPAEIGIQVEAAMSQAAQRDGQMLRPLHPGVPVRHRQNYDIGLAWNGWRKLVAAELRIVPGLIPLLRLGFRFHPEVKPLQIEGPDVFFQAFNGYAPSSPILESVRQRCYLRNSARLLACLMSLIKFEHVSKTFLRSSSRMVLDRFRGGGPNQFFALKDVSFEIHESETVGVIGGNGAGKSTLLSLVAGISYPDEGAVTVEGRVAALLELGSGFHGDLTGRENVFLNASLLGLSRKKTLEKYDEIVDFSGVGDFINEPLRTYSSGMTMRLAFSVAINIDPSFLIIDEVLAVGDATFQAKCYEKIVQFKRAGKGLLIVSHAGKTIQQLCERAIWLDHGKLVMDGRTEDVVAAYSGETPLVHK
jgi:lipopolysaccharide transport system ATP-binding protein